ncbi:AMP-dependent synthetase and ligase family protein [Artemisia annua]|uniref:AMP-dependent synthetase and ligase family protein n=1 Tax=Artemisia annua TaxID=35608 RepID=A0A2U1MVK4_ARTAN|nr:AMP-dependent synthetase and ligase family protein [Artemisia annua]
MDQLKPTSANSCPLTPLTFLQRAATVYGDCISVVYNETIFTWSQTSQRCLQVASSLVELGIRRGDVVSVLAFNVPAMYELQFVVPMSGAVLNNLNTRLDSSTIYVMLRHSSQQNIDSSANNVNICTTYEDLVKNGDLDFDWVRPVSECDPITLNYTSGTTSSPKGVVHSHRAIFVITFDSLIDWSVPKTPVYLWILPMFHSNGWSFTWGMAAVGGTNICLPKFKADDVFSNVIRHNVTHMCGAPVVLNMIANSPNAKPLLNPVHFLTGGALLLRLYHGYGMTEVAGVVVSCAWKEKWNQVSVKDRAILKARQGVRTLGLTDVNVLDRESGIGVKRDGLTQGEIVLKGACLMLGYFKDPQATTQCMTEDGWLYTGDVGVIHPDGYIEIKDRSKDIIITGGENVSSVEVESVLYSNPVVHEAAVVARPEKFWGETPCAFVSLIGKASSNDIIMFFQERLPRYMVPKMVVFMEELPKMSTGKVMKCKLRDIAKNMYTRTGMSKM